MSVREYELYHGAAILRLLAIAGDLQVTKLEKFGTGCYLLSGRIGCLIKYSTDRLTPWSFTFNEEHKQTIRKLEQSFSPLLVLLVCRMDGIVSLSGNDLWYLIGDQPGSAAIGVTRRPREMYQVSGPAGTLPRKLSEAAYAKELLNTLPSN